MRARTFFVICAALAAGAAVLIFLFSPLRWHIAPLLDGSPSQTDTKVFDGAAISTYRNSPFDFSLTYPSDLSVVEYDENGGTKSIVFQKPDALVGFQMFITPDPGDNPLTPADIKLDFSTLEIVGTQSITVGTGTPAVAFASNTPDFGPTRELWFTHDGYLFEIVTYSNLGPWLAHIVNTIRF